MHRGSGRDKLSYYNINRRIAVTVNVRRLKSHWIQQLLTDSNLNPYQPIDTRSTDAKSEEVIPSCLNKTDLQDLRIGTRRVNERGGFLALYLWPALAFVFAAYQFWMCWHISTVSGTSFSELLFHDNAGFPNESYSGGFVRTFDRLVTGFCALLVAAFTFFMARGDRKRESQNHRFHTAMLTAGIVPRDPKHSH